MECAQKAGRINDGVTRLKDRLKAMIQSSGPLPVAAYMDLCLHDRQHGYYATRPGLGRDFITAPEISQVFGELIGLWLAQEWQSLGAPKRFNLVEIGPGRGTLMRDALRAVRSVDGFLEAAQLNFVEPSPALRAHLSETFAPNSPVFLEQLDDVETDLPVLIVANEWLDCLPVQQYVRAGEAWHERVVGLSETDDLAFGLSDQDAPFHPDIPEDQSDLELQPGLKTLVELMDRLLNDTPGRALLIDYGTTGAAPGDTLRAYQGGSQIDPLLAPGESDLTCDVDFGRLKRLADAQNLASYGSVSQSRFLLALGAEMRLNQLASAHPDQADELYAGVKRLVDPSDMGERFQVICLSSPDLASPAAF